MKNMKYGLLFGLAAAALMLLVGCQNGSDPSTSPVKSGYGMVQIITAGGGDGRTILPPVEPFSYYRYVVKEGATEIVDELLDAGEYLEIPVGTGYTVHVEAYIGTKGSGTLVASGDSEETFNVVAATATSVDVKLKPVNAQPGDTGSFTYNVSYPEKAKVKIELVSWPDLFKEVDINLPEATGTNSSGTVSLAPGSYLLTVLVSKGKMYTGLVEAVHIYPYRETKYEKVFNDSEMVANNDDAKLDNMEGITIFGEPVTSMGTPKHDISEAVNGYISVDYLFSEEIKTTGLEVTASTVVRFATVRFAMGPDSTDDVEDLVWKDGAGLQTKAKSATVKPTEEYDVLFVEVTAADGETKLYYKVTINYKQLITVTLQDVTADGSASVPKTTTALTLTFDKPIIGLSAADITLSDDEIGKGTLGASGAVYTLPITGLKSSKTLTVTVERDGYNIISGSGLTVDIIYSLFDSSEGIKDLVVASPGKVSVNTVTGIISGEIDNGYSNYFSIKIPETTSLPIIASDTIVISYVAFSTLSQIEITPKTKGSSGGDDLTPPEYSNFVVNPSTIQTLRLEASLYGASIPISVLWFQGRPNTATWKLKIIDITLEPGDPITVTTAVSIKPAPGKTPVTTLDNLQYSGYVSWKDSDDEDVVGNFEASTAYTATIVLTAKQGYTFEGIAADKFPVTGAAENGVIHAAGSTTSLEITAEFPETATPAPAFSVDGLTDSSVKATGSTSIEVDADGKTFTVTNGTPDYQGAVVYFQVTFDDVYTVSDYTKIDIKTQALNSAAQWKPLRIAAYKDEPTSVSLASGSDDIIAAQESANPVGSIGDGVKSVTLDIVSVKDEADLNTVWIGICVHAGTGAEYTLSDIKFYNP